jgi:hypothetical protein
MGNATNHFAKLPYSPKFVAVQHISNDLCELKLRERIWHKNFPEGSRNSESDFATFTLSTCLLLSLIIVKLPWGQPI